VPPGRRNASSIAAIAVALFLPAQTAHSQAWLPPAQVFSVSLSYNDVLNFDHYLPNGDEVDVGHTRTHAYGLSVSYSPTDRLMVTAALPYVVTQFWGERPHPTEVDDGHEHATFTDLRVSVHYQWLERPVALAPYLAIVTPVTDYETLGHAAPGRGLNEAWVGFGIGMNLAERLPGTYVQGRANYAFVEKVAGVSHDRTNLDVEIGYFINPKWSIRALGFWQFAHGGVDVPMPPTDPLYRYHDQLAAESFLNVGAGAAFAVSPRAVVYGTYLTSVRGENGHKLDHGVTLGLTYGIAPSR
jgi:hypothetical protein